MTPSTTRYKRGDVVLVPFPFTDLTGVRQRPAVVVSAEWFNDTHADVALAAITSQIPATLGPDEILIAGSDRALTGLPRNSILRVVKLFALDRSLVRRQLGTLPSGLIAALNGKLSLALSLPSPEILIAAKILVAESNRLVEAVAPFMTSEALAQAPSLQPVAARLAELNRAVHRVNALLS